MKLEERGKIFEALYEDRQATVKDGVIVSLLVDIKDLLEEIKNK